MVKTMNETRARVILESPLGRTAFQIGNAASIILEKLNSESKKVRSLEKIVEHQEAICKDYVQSVEGKALFFRNKEMAVFINSLSEDTLLQIADLNRIANTLSNAGLEDRRIKDVLITVAAMCKKGV